MSVLRRHAPTATLAAAVFALVVLALHDRPARWSRPLRVAVAVDAPACPALAALERRFGRRVRVVRVASADAALTALEDGSVDALACWPRPVAARARRRGARVVRLASADRSSSPADSVDVVLRGMRGR